MVGGGDGGSRGGIWEVCVCVCVCVGGGCLEITNTGLFIHPDI